MYTRVYLDIFIEAHNISLISPVNMSYFEITEQTLPKTRHDAYKFALKEGLVPRPPTCLLKIKGHKNPSDIMSHYYLTETDLGIYKCSKNKQCKRPISVATGTWFEESRLSPEKEFR